MLDSLWNGIKALIPFQRGHGIPAWVRWVAWIVLDLVFVGLLYLLNDPLRINDLVRNLGPLQEFRTYLEHWWLPIFGQLVILLGVILYWFYLLWFSDIDDSPFPEIDEDWLEAVDTLARVGIRLPQAPLFLVLGRPASSEEQLFEAAGLKSVLPHPTPTRREFLRVFAGRLPNRDEDAVFVTCRGASVLGKLAGILALENLADGSPALEGEVPDEFTATQPSTNFNIDIAEMLPAPEQDTPLRRRARRRFTIAKALGADFMANAEQVALHKAKFAHLCRLIVRDRQPYCGVNGILALVPLAATDTSAEAQLTAQALHDDLSIARHEMKLECPVISLLVDVEDLPGALEFIQRTNARDLKNRRGSGFPMKSRLTREQVLQEIHNSLVWVCGNYWQNSIMSKFQIETPQNTDPNFHFPGNASMVLLLDEMNSRAESLTTIIQHSIAPQNEALFRYAGCYVAATGPKGKQGFVEGVLRKLFEEQSCVKWTDAAFIEDAHHRWWANTYRITTLILAIATITAIVALAMGWLDR